VSSKGPNGRMHIFPSYTHTGRHTVYLDDHIIGVLQFGGEGCRILRLKLGRDEAGKNVFVGPVGNLSYLDRPYDTTTAAADACLEHWLGRSAA
jgi:hypothetical protein